MPDDLEALVADRVGSAREARWLVEHVGRDPRRALALADRRAAGEPLQYVLGRWPFRRLELSVDRRVLIPRPETEQVVEVALTEFASLLAAAADRRGRHRHRRPEPPWWSPVCLDLGTGSGAIALSLAVEAGALAPGLVVWATDSSRDALVVAAGNLDELARSDPAAADRVRLTEGRWFDALPPSVLGTVDLLVVQSSLRRRGRLPRSRPHRAAVGAPCRPGGGPDAHGVGGMADIEAIIADAARWLRPSGVMVIEIDPAQAEAAARRVPDGPDASRCGTRA